MRSGGRILDRRGARPVAIIGSAGCPSTRFTTCEFTVRARRRRKSSFRRRPKRVSADRAYDYDSRRRQLRERGSHPRSRGATPRTAPDWAANRWVVERTFAWLHQFKRLLVRYDRRADIHETFLDLACCLVCYRRLKNSSLSKEL